MRWVKRHDLTWKLNITFTPNDSSKLSHQNIYLNKKRRGTNERPHVNMRNAMHNERLHFQILLNYTKFRFFPHRKSKLLDKYLWFILPWFLQKKREAVKLPFNMRFANPTEPKKQNYNNKLKSSLTVLLD